jgi:two-component system sensor histidine kinase YesM
MKILKNPWNQTILIRLISVFLLLLVPIYGIGYGIFSWGIKAIRTEITNSVYSHGAYYLENLSREIQRIKLLQYDCLDDDDLKKLSLIPESMDDQERTTAIRRLYRRIMVLNNSSNYIEDVFIHIPSIDRTIYAYGTISDIPKEEYQALLKSLTSSNAQIVYWNDKMLISAMAPMPYQQWLDNPAFIIEIELSKAEFSGALQQFNNYNGSSSFLINSQDGQLIGSAGSKPETLAEFNNLNSKFGNIQSGTSMVQAGGLPYIAVYQTDKYLGMTLIRYIPEKEVFSTASQYQVWFWIFSVASLMVILLFSFLVYRLIHKPLFRLVTSFKRVERGDFNIKIENDRNDEFKYIYHNFNIMVEKIRVLIEQVIDQRTLAHRAELKQLQSQINPHFLYNCFFLLCHYAYAEGSETTGSLAGQLGKYFQFITRGIGDEVVLSREVEHARVYNEIQAVRFSNRIKIQFDELPERFASLMVPKLILQPVLENAFEHGLANTLQDGRLHVSFQEENGFLFIRIEDNGSGMNEEDFTRLQNILCGEEQENETTGIVNIHRRLQLKFGPESGAMVSRGNQGGLIVTLKLKSQ